MTNLFGQKIWHIHKNSLHQKTAIYPINTIQHTTAVIATAYTHLLGQHAKRHQQKTAVRQLLQYTLSQYLTSQNKPIRPDDFYLDESAYPFRLYVENSWYFVCFSHTQNTQNALLSLIISKHKAGIDSEYQTPSLQVAKRFFHHDEILKLDNLPAREQSRSLKLLWQCKEAMIKLSCQTLTAGMGKDFGWLIDKIIYQTADTLFVDFDDNGLKNHYQIVMHSDFVAIVEV